VVKGILGSPEEDYFSDKITGRAKVLTEFTDNLGVHTDKKLIKLIQELTVDKVAV